MITAISMVKNEEDILEAFITHTLAYVDRLLVLENGSTDTTPAILQRLQQQGYALEVISDPTFRYNQSEKITALYHRALEHRPQFVIPLDSDEFIQAPSRELLHQRLATIPPNGAGKWRWRTCLPTAPNELELSKRFPVARKHEDPNHGKVILRPPANYRDPVLVIAQGYHSAKRNNRNLRTTAFDDIYIAHLPVRSVQQLAQKAILGWMANVAHFKTTAPACGFHWGELYHRALELTSRDLVREAYNYSEHTSRSDLDLTASHLHLAGACTTLNAAVTAELDLRALLEQVCRNWEAQLLRS
jgi:glycosyltransferase involved in cell wall biosynthesis